MNFKEELIKRLFFYKMVTSDCLDIADPEGLASLIEETDYIMENNYEEWLIENENVEAFEKFKKERS